MLINGSNKLHNDFVPCDEIIKKDRLLAANFNYRNLNIDLDALITIPINKTGN